MATNHGLQIAEDGIRGAGELVWDVVEERGDCVAVCGPHVLLRTTTGRPSWSWTKSLVSELGILTPALHEYSQFEPRSKKLFSRMCKECLGSPRWYAVALPGSTADDVAKSLLLRFDAHEASLMKIIVLEEQCFGAAKRLRLTGRIFWGCTRDIHCR